MRAQPSTDSARGKGGRKQPLVEMSLCEPWKRVQAVCSIAVHGVVNLPVRVKWAKKMEGK